MGVVEATVEIVTGLAWPAVVLVAIVLLRRQLGRLVLRLTHLKAPGVEADFGEQAAATNELAEVAVPSAPPTLDRQPFTGDGSVELNANPSLDDLLVEADRHPVGGIVRAWNVAEDVARSLSVKMVQTLGIRRLTDDGSDARRLAHALSRLGYVNDEIVGLADKLSRLRESIVHGSQIADRQSARDFVEATWRLASALLDGVADAYIDAARADPDV